MNPRAAFLACLEQKPPALFEAALWIAAEHQPHLQPDDVLRQLDNLQLQVNQTLPNLPAKELAQPLIRQLSELGFCEDDELPLRPQVALLNRVLQRRRGQPLALALLALELARRLGIALQGVNFPGRFLLRVPGANYLLDPCSGRRLHARECREMLQRHLGPNAELSAGLLQACDAPSMLQRLSRNLRHLHQQAGDPLAALRDAERVLLLGTPNLQDHLARAEIYQQLECPQGERFDLQRALLLSEDPTQHLQLSQRLRSLNTRAALH
jgi:regulator of sirC expression with transglutaminase-like and TPR domain